MSAIDINNFMAPMVLNVLFFFTISNIFKKEANQAVGMKMHEYFDFPKSQVQEKTLQT